MAEELASVRAGAKSSIASTAEASADLRRYSPILATLPPEAFEHLHVAVQRAATRSARSMITLRIAVESFTDALRDDGASPEAVLIALKTVINSRTFPVSDLGAGELSANELRHQISTWCIEEFFREKRA